MYEEGLAGLLATVPSFDMKTTKALDAFKTIFLMTWLRCSFIKIMLQRQTIFIYESNALVK